MSLPTLEQYLPTGMTPWASKDVRLFFCDGEDAVVYRGLRAIRTIEGGKEWFERLGRASASLEDVAAYLQDVGHIVPRGQIKEFTASLQRVKTRFQWVAGPIRDLLARNTRHATAGGFRGLAFIDLLETLNLPPRSQDKLVVRKAVMAPIVTVTNEGDAHVIFMTAELVEPVGQPTVDNLSHFPSSRIAFVLFDDRWLSSFDSALTAAQSVVATAADLRQSDVGRGKAIRWGLKLRPLWESVASGQSPVDSVCSFPLKGTSASAAFALMTAHLLAADLGCVPCSPSTDGTHPSLSELRALPLNELLVSAEVDVGGRLHRVDGLDSQGTGRLPPKLIAAEAFTQSRTLLAIGLADEEVSNIERAGGCPLVRATNLTSLAKALWSGTSPTLYGSAMGLPAELDEDSDSGAAYRNRRADAWVHCLIDARVREAEDRRTGSYIVLEAESGWGKTSFALQWVRDAQRLPIAQDARLRPAGWTFARVGSGFPWSDVARVLLGLEHCARHNLCLRRNGHTEDSIATDSQSRFHQFIQDCASWSADNDKLVVLLVDGLDEVLGDRPEVTLREWLPLRLPPGIHMVLTSDPCGILDTGAWEPSAQLPPLDLQDAKFEPLRRNEALETLPSRPAIPQQAELSRSSNATSRIARVSGLPDGWERNFALHLARQDPAGRRIVFKQRHFAILRWEADWSGDSTRVVRAIDSFPDRLPVVVLGWPGGSLTSDLEAHVDRQIRGRRAVLVICDAPPVKNSWCLLAHLEGDTGQAQPVNVGTLPGLDRGPYVLLVESGDADAVLRSIMGAESHVPPSQARRWWLDLGVLTSDSRPAGAMAAEGADREWLRRFPDLQPVGLFIRHPCLTVEQVVALIASHPSAAAAVVSPFGDWLDKLSVALTASKRGHLRAQAGCDAETQAAQPLTWDEDVLQPLEDLLDIGALTLPRLRNHLPTCKHLIAWKRDRATVQHRTGSHAAKIRAGQIPDLAVAIAAMERHHSPTALEFVDAMACHVPALTPSLARACATVESLQGKLAGLLDIEQDAFGDAAAYRVVDQLGVTHDQVAAAAAFGSRPALRLALACLRHEGDTPADQAAFRALCAQVEPGIRKHLESIGGVIRQRLQRSVLAVRLASRAGRRGKKAVDEMLAAASFSPGPRQSVLWAGVWSGAAEDGALAKVLGDPSLWPALGLTLDPVELTEEEILEARLGVKRAW